MSLRDKESLKGYVFFIPLIIGLITFFFIPTVKSFLFSISDVTSGADGYKFTVTGFSAYKNALFVHTSYRQTVIQSAIYVITTTPLVILFSFFMSNPLESSMGAYSSYKGADAAAVSFTAQITDLLIQSGISEKVTSGITSLVDGVYNVIGLSAIQILIMLIGMQSISPSLYEAATVEGATRWESFWKITFPMVSPMIMTCIIYTIIDTFTDNSNSVMTLMSQTGFEKLQFSLASAMGWIYFAAIAVILGTVALTVSRLLFYYDD